MASASSSTSRPNQNPTITYDVFLSFRGEDTRYTFTDHLYHALRRAGLDTFRDEEEIDRCHELKPEIETAIIESRASVVVLSETYARSRWCLNELSLIIEQRRKCDHLVLPVFYHVDPSHVRHQKESYTLKGTEDDVTGWKDALRDVASLKGDVLHLSGKTYETDFIDKVVETVNCQLDRKHVISTPDQLTGMEPRIEGINSLLKNEQYNIIAIHGMGGIGKTTLAQWIYNLNKHGFKNSSFVEKIGENYKHGMLLSLQKKLLIDISGNKKIKISDALEGTSKIAEVLRRRKVFIVLDDIDDKEELNILLGTKVFHAESKIIITTRLLDLDAWFASASKSSGCKVHKLNFLNGKESLQLFSWHAFPSKIIIEGFEDLAKQLAQYCGGNPLALRVLGSSLLFTDENLSKRKDIIKCWRDRMNSLNSSKGDLDYQIQEVLRKSFDSLSLARHKDLFLHIACFFVGEYEEHVISILQDDLHAKYGMMILVNKCLLTISHSGHLVMHQLLREMGRKIVCEESKDLAKRSRVWDDDESYHVLEKGNGSETIEGLSLDIENVKQKTTILQTSSLAKMDKLKLLQLKYVKLTGSYENFPELRWLCWHGCRLETMYPGLLKNSLVKIDLSYGNMETFKVPAVLNSLKILNLKLCYKLASICNLYHFPKLEELLLSNCSSLTHLCKSIGDLESLALLDLKGCVRLLKVSSNKKNVESRPKRPLIDDGNSEQPLFSLPCSLKFLYLNNCQIMYNNGAQVAFQASPFFNLCLERNPFEFLPSYIDLKMLRTLDLNSCSRLKSMPCIPSTLEELYVDRCSSLEKVTFQSNRFSLRQFSYKGCSKLFEVQGLFKLVPIAKIEEADLGHMQWILATIDEDQNVDLVGDDITEGRDPQIQMLHEYGITSVYLQSIKDQSLMTSEYMSGSNLLSFHVPFHHEKNRIQGLYVSCLYRSSKPEDNGKWCLLAKINNKTKGLTWVYNPVVYCEPGIGEDVLWLSYWPIGCILDASDEVHVSITVDEGVIVSGCGASLVHMDGEVETKEICENSTMKGEEVIGGDLSQFKVTTKGYYLCRRDLFGLDTSSRLKELFGDSVDYPESQGWKKTRQSSTRSYIPDMIIYDVFLSFQGRDTRYSFISSLNQELLQAGLRICTEVDEIPIGKEIKNEIETAVIGSRASIVVLSENYVNSRWCLDELCLILEQRRNANHFVLPLFYHVNPSDVRRQRGSFSLDRFNGTENNTRRWKEALTEVANFSGMVVSGHEANAIKKVVDAISHKLG